MKKHKPTTLLTVLAFCLVGQFIEAQHLPVVVSVFNNATLLPGSGKLGVFGIPVHPGLSLGTEFRYNKDAPNEWYQTAKLSYYYHHYVQHSVQLYSEVGYRYHFKGRFDTGPRLGVGYLHSIPDAQIFELDSKGIYQKNSHWGRPQLMASLAIEVGCALFQWQQEPVRLFIAYQFYLQMPFVQEYVPLLPNTALHLGLSLPFWHKE